MQIKDYDTPLPHISLFDEREGSRSKSLSLYIWKPAIGSLAQPYIPLDDSLHIKNWTIKPNKETIAASSFSTATRSEEVLILNSSLHTKEPSAAKLIKSCQRKYIQSLWEELCNDISNTLVDQISSLEECINEVVEEITRIDSSIALPLMDSLAGLLTKAKKYDSSRALASEKISKEAYAEILSKANAHLLEVKAMEEKTTNHLQSLHGKRESIEDRKIILQKDLDDLEKQNMEVSSTIDREYENLKRMQVEVLRAQDQISSIQSTTFLTNEDARELEKMSNILEASKIAVVDLKFDT